VRRIADEGHLHDLAVHPLYRRLGIARKLLDEAVASLRVWVCRFFYLEVRASSQGARSLYGKCGFRTVGTRKNYYAYPTEDALIMVREL
jgi:ribosomal-protein-alanine N-acetyltransferase